MTKPMPPAPNQEAQSRYVSKNAFLPISNDMSTEVYIVAIKNRFGNVDAQITPLRGYGKQWVLASRLKGMYTPQ